MRVNECHAGLCEHLGEHPKSVFGKYWEEKVRAVGLTILGVGFLLTTGAHAQTPVVQSELCALETSSFNEERAIVIAINSERNPIRQQDLQRQLTKQRNEDFLALVRFFGGSYTVFGQRGRDDDVDRVGQLKGSRPFQNFSGRMTALTSNAIGGFDFTVQIDCAHPLFIGTRTVALTPTTPDYQSDVNVLRDPLSLVNLGDQVLIDGTIVLVAAPMAHSPSYTNGATYFSARITSIRKQ